MTDRALYFTAPRTVETRPIEVGDPDPGEVLVETHVSAISPGTELLIYRGEAPERLPADETIDHLDGDLSFPLRYGYAAVGDVVAAGAAVDDDWLDRTVFGFAPHQTRFRADPASLVALPRETSPSRGALLPTAETAVNLALDAAPRVGERVAVFGAGAVGLSTIRVLSAFPLARLVAVDPLAERRELAREAGADAAVAPDAAADEFAGAPADIAVEVSGQPEALDDAIDVVSFDGRVVVGSWYGTKRASLDLGGRFHRDRVELVSSQVSTVDPDLRGRWDVDRRMETAVEWLSRLDAEALVTDRVAFESAADAYERLDDHPDDTIQVLLTYS